MVRFKNRYLLAELCWHDLPPTLSATPPTLPLSVLATHIRSSIEVNFGEHLAALLAQSLSLKYFNNRTGLLVLRTARDYVVETAAACTFISFMPYVAHGSSSAASRQRCTLSVHHISGTIKSCQKAAIRLSKRWILQENLLLDPNEPRPLKKAKLAKIDLDETNVQKVVDAIERLEP